MYPEDRKNIPGNDTSLHQPSIENAVISAPAKPCLVVGIGASAGGQEALEQLFTSLPVDCGVAFVVVMHLPPEGPSFLADMLSRYTPMAVVTAEEGMVPLRNTVHVIPAGKELSLTGDPPRLHLEERGGGRHHPIDRFFSSLAATERGGRSVAVVLSGCGTDGTEGAKAIRDAGGVVIAQDPATAASPAMPQSAIAAGAATLVLPPEDIPEKIAEMARGACALTSQECRPVTLEGELHTIFTIVKERTGHDFSSYKRNTIIRRIERRMMVHEVGGMSKYIALLQENPQEAQALCKDILIGVTSFFRDPEAFERLRQEIIPRLFAGRDPEDPVRIWHACCASGEEAYSMAMLVREYLDEQRMDAKVQIFASDIDEVAIAQARAGLYDDAIRAEVGEERLSRFFTRNEGRWQVTKSLREMIVFAHHSLIKDPPFSRLDLLVCRNFLIYLNPDMQKRLITLFHQVLKPAAVLFLGSAESVGHGAHFVTIDKKWKIYGRRDGAHRGDLPFPPGAARFPQAVRPLRHAAGEETTPAALAEKALLERYAQPSVVVNEKYEVVHLFGRTGRFLELPEGEPTRDVLKMAREELRPALRAAIYKGFTERAEVSFRGVKVGAGAEESAVNIVVQPLGSSAGGKLLLVTFEAVVPASAVAVPAEGGAGGSEGDLSRLLLVRQLEDQLRITHEQLQATSEQLETANEGFLSTSEELMSINEEFQSANEELQSTNEELETSKEELQALNEELVTVNAELQGKVEELNLATGNMENLLATSGIATVFLDRRLALKGFTPAAAQIFHLIQADIGRPFRHFAGKIDWDSFSADAEAVLAGEPFAERELLLRERCHLKRLFPYRTPDGSIAGLVVTLIDIAQRKEMEDALRDSERKFATLFSKASLPAVLSRFPDHAFVDVNDAWADLFGYSREELIGKTSFELGINRDGERRARTIAEIERQSSVLNREVTLYAKSGEAVTVLTNVNVIEIAGEKYALTSLQDITERKRAEAQLAQSKMKLEAALESMTDAVFISDTEGRFVDFNEAFATFHKFANKEECAKTFAEYPDILDVFLPSGELAPVDQWAVPRALRGETATNAEYTLRRKDTGETWVGSYSFAPIRDDEGNITGSVVAGRDITEAQVAQEAVRASEERYRALVESAQIAIFVNRNNRIEYANPAAVQLFGAQSPEAVLGRSPYEFVHPDLHEVMTQRIGIVLQGGSVPLMESRIVRPDGQERVVEVAAVLFSDRKGRGLQVMMHDITERKEAEAALRESEEQFRTLADAIPQLCWMADADGWIFWYNRRWYEYTGTTPQEMEGWGWQSVHDKEVLPAVMQRWQGSIATGAPFDMTFPLRGADGVFRPFLTRVLPVRDRDGKIVRWFGTNTDVTEQRSVEEALRQAKEGAEAATRAKSQFLANMSHELRTPMTGVLGMLDLVLLGELDREQRESICTAHNSARSLLRILNDILDLTKLEAAKFSIEEKPFALRQCLENTFSVLLPVAQNKRLSFSCQVADDVPEVVVGDQVRLNQILTNLAGNAVKFTERGKVEIAVVSGGSAPGGREYVTFSVADTGIGIPEGKKELLFREFSQVDDSHSRSYGGTGLGLAISREIVERMGGTITFTSQEGAGSTFSFTVPLRKGEGAPEGGEPSGEIAETPSAVQGGRRARILIAEDDPTIREVLQRMLQRSNFEIGIAENGRQAVERWEGGAFDLILMDVQMPQMNGFEATAAIREKERGSGGHIHIIAMTAHALKEDEARCLDAGMDRYISKPIDFNLCRTMIEEVVNNVPATP